VEAHIVRIECLLLDLAGTIDEPSEAMLTSMLRIQLSGIQKFAPIFAQVDIFGQLPFAALLKAVKSVCIETRESKVAKAQAKAAAAPAKATSTAAPGKGKGKGDGKDGGKDSKGKGKGKGKDAKDAKDKIKCTHCGGKRHTADQCWRNPSSPSYKPELDQATAATASHGSGAGSAGAAAMKAEAERAVAQAMAKFAQAGAGIALAGKGTTDFIIDSGASFNFVGKEGTSPTSPVHQSRCRRLVATLTFSA